ncbi:MAG: sulfate reduction electron transfer complex DsrMKJOP subunit DsrM [Deltaproteobacteria bacterium]|nr:sulfate reduction electron transfer complex DsrMKJOP subunit DsrM [Deltaproteobacteria bacterium]
MGIIYALIAMMILIFIPWTGVQGLGLTWLFSVMIPYAALTVFFFGVVQRLIQWSRIPNPFRIPTTGGQQKSLNWIRQSKLDNPHTTGQVIGRIFTEVVLFRSLFRNLVSRMETDGGGVSYVSAKWLWLFAILFHYAMLVTVFRHLRFFTNPVPGPVRWVEGLDGWLEVGIPQIMISGLVLLGALSLLLSRRFFIPRLRYISLLNDYFPLFLLMTIAGTGILMRYYVGVDTTQVKQVAMGLISFQPVVPEGVGPLFFVHLFSVCVLLAYFPFSKLMHAGGIFFSPTRGQAGNNRAVHHENPWNYPVKFHAYADYEETFRDKMVAAGIPVEHPASTVREEEKSDGR